MPTPLEVEVDKLIAFIEANSADHTDMREALTQAGIRLGRRCDQARVDELADVKAFRDSELAKSGKTPIAKAEAVAAVEAVAEIKP